MMAIKKASVLITEALSLSDSLNGTRTRVLALRGLRPRPLVDEAMFFVAKKYYHEKFFSAILIIIVNPKKILRLTI